ncbi:putative aldouronate transport system substrate-binding protein [Virgibacillus natechei]|uniref:Aldouronate transport system substrate-binding protein n=1 Tax=Virgibacillus natechei TaxID=1216297 RepID=A0ABS4IEG5_9BACI|nr:extracellular solute-binding protein [Virgibacillus natechei]MBP1969333.1 putative aldouronate transport system substrate-binding protein [Virgibacillus natechei]UZD12484.1 extracellular solute-binding protein [Virgibacillus natechei]
MLKKPFVLLGITMIAMIILAACTEESDAESEENGLTNITTVRTLDDGTVFKDGEDVNDNVVTEWAEEELGIHFDTVWTRPNDEQYNQQMRLGMSANEPLPDVFQVTDGQMIADLIESGRVMPIDDAIEEHASPRLKELFEQFPEAFYEATDEDGQRFGIPRFSGGNGSDTLLWVRQDWLDEFDLEAPETIEELENVMDIFVNEDPDGNGSDDTLGMTLSAGDVGFGRTNIGDTSFIFGAFGDYSPGLWSEAEDGSLVYGSIQPNMKEGLAKIKEWLEKGYISQEIAIEPADQAQESFVSGQSGLMAAPPWAFDYPIGDVFQNVPEAEVKPYPLPSGMDGQAGRKGESLSTGSFLFSSEFEHMDKFFEYLDAIYGYTFGESEYFEDGLFEGYDYIMVDDEPVYDAGSIEEETGEDKVDPGRYLLPTNVPTIPYDMYDLLEEFHETDREPESAYEANLANNKPEYIEAAAIVNSQNDIRIENGFTGAPTETMESSMENLERLELELFANIVYGNQPLDAFDDFVEEWKSSGGDQMTEEVNEWYESVQE